MNNFLSIVVPCFNCKLFLKDCIDSVLRQNLSNFEVIFVDDFCTDGSSEILNNYCSKYKNFKVIRNKKNIGCPESRNVGIEESEGDIIFNLDSDNVLPDNMLLKMLDFFVNKTKEHLCSVSTIKYFKGNKLKVHHTRDFENRKYGIKDLLKNLENPFTSGNYMYTKECWKNVGKYEPNTNRVESWYFSFKSIISGYQFDIFPKSFYWHRQGIKSLTIVSKKNNLDHKTWKRLLCKHISIFDDKTKEYLRSNEFKDVRGRIMKGKFGFNDDFINSLILKTK